MNPFAIEGPAVISFSGGRTSAFMLRRILDAGIGPDVHVLFANTGKERPETLDFVRDCSTRWCAQVHWLKFTLPEDPGCPRYREVTYETASRNGEPFDALLAIRAALPNPTMRFCTQELKIRPMCQWMQAAGYKQWESVVGIRADEPRRVARMRAHNVERNDPWDNVLPLADVGVTKSHVMAFWAAQPFDLQLQPYEGNCDLCFLKHISKRRRVAREHPELVAWWSRHEIERNLTFRRDEPPYAALLDQLDLFEDAGGEDLVACECTD